MELRLGYRPMPETAEDVLKAWNEGKDFKVVGGAYCSIRDFDHLKNCFSVIVLRSKEGVTPIFYENEIDKYIGSLHA